MIPMKKYVAFYSVLNDETILTERVDEKVPDAELIEEAVLEAYVHELIGDAGCQVSEDELRAQLKIVMVEGD